MRQRPDGSIQSSNVPTQQNINRVRDFALYRCMVEKVLPVDDSDNVTENATNPEVLYDVVILGGSKAGQKISNCRLATFLGGNLNFAERTLKATTKKFRETGLSDHDGDIVYVQFIQGHAGYPVITGLAGGVNTAELIGALEEEIPRLKEQFNGNQRVIDKNGETTLTRFGGAFEDGEFLPNEDVIWQKRWFEIEKVEESFFTGLKNEWDGELDIHTRTYNGGLKHTEDGDNDLNEIRTSAGALLKLAEAKVALGADGTEVLDEVSKALAAIIAWVNNIGANHTHLGNLGYPTLLPIETSDYIQLGTDLQAIQDAIDSIKGTL